MSKQEAMGRGLGALLKGVGAEPDDFLGNGTSSAAGKEPYEVALDKIDNDTSQPRHVFDDEKLEELAQSIRVHGIMQPLLVAPIEDDRYRIIAGERRFRAAKLAGLAVVPVIVRQVEDSRDALELALIENIQREDLNPIEQAEALRRLVKDHGLKQDEVAERVGKSRSAIANLMRLSNLPEAVRDLVSQKLLSAGHARALLPLDEEEAIVKVAQQIVKNDMSVRQTEDIVRRMLLEKDQEKTASTKPVLTPEVKDAQMKLSSLFDTKVRIVGSEEKGKITLDYYSKEQLNNLYDALMKGSSFEE